MTFKKTEHYIRFSKAIDFSNLISRPLSQKVVRGNMLNRRISQI